MNEGTSRFDERIDRRRTDSLKYDFAVRRGKPDGVLPFWVADMDFRAPDPVLRALEDRCHHGIFGYSESGDDYRRTVCGWFARRFGWEPDPRWLVKTPGVVTAICMAIRAFTKEGDAVMVQQPVYYPFTESVLANRRELAVNRLREENGRYTMDFEEMESQIRARGVKLLLLCSPHNPVGRVWSRDELRQVGEICRRHGVVVVSDEIHADFVYAGHTHTVFAAVDPAFAEFTVVCTAPTKTFNLAGLQISNIFIPNRDLRHAFREEMERAGLSQMNVMGLTACRAAYEQGEPWLEELKEYLAENLAFVRAFLRERLPSVKLTEPEGTYLVWLDFRALGLGSESLDALLLQKAGLWLDAGPMFGAGGEGFQRVNIACPRSLLREGLERLEKAVHA